MKTIYKLLIAAILALLCTANVSAQNIKHHNKDTLIGTGFDRALIDSNAVDTAGGAIGVENGTTLIYPKKVKPYIKTMSMQGVFRGLIHPDGTVDTLYYRQPVLPDTVHCIFMAYEHRGRILNYITNGGYLRKSFIPIELNNIDSASSIRVSWYDGYVILPDNTPLPNTLYAGDIQNKFLYNDRKTPVVGKHVVQLIIIKAQMTGGY